MSSFAALRRRPRIVAIAVMLAVAAMVSFDEQAEAKCAPSTGCCHGCGCKGGPGWREMATERCVGFRDIDQKCGRPPSNRLCVFENAPGTGANRDCALAPATPPPSPVSPPTTP